MGSDRVLIGAYEDDTGATAAGAAYLFSANGTLLTTFTNPTPAAYDNFGNSVTAVGSDRVLIGALLDDTRAHDAGAAYLFSTETFTPALVADGVSAQSITTASLADGAATSVKIAMGAVGSGQIAGNAVTSAEIADGSIVASDVNAASFSTVFWRAVGNAGTTAGTHFLGTMDGQPLEFKVNGLRALRLEPNAASPNVIGGYSGNVVGVGNYGSTIAGGGFFDYSNAIFASFAAIAGGGRNDIGTNADFSSIGGGNNNNIDADSFVSTIAGGGS